MTNTVGNAKDHFVVTAFWEAKPGEESAVEAILDRYAPQAKKEEWVVSFVIHRSRTEPTKFFFYEVFKDEAGFAAHQETAHFKELVVGQALPKLAKRERAQYSILY
jgi:quinol monooxygenase YgiN